MNKKIQEKLFKNQDLKYRDFTAKLTPTINKKDIIGVRVPVLRKLAKEFSKDPNIEQFLQTLPHKYIEEFNIHGLIICTFNDYDNTIKYINKLLPYINNWATCDIINPKSFINNKEKLKKDILKWITSKKVYTIRFGIEMIMTHFIGEDLDLDLMEKVSKIRSNEYYVNMMIAWYFATALAKNWEETLPFIKDFKLDKWTHNKTIQKARESYRITKKQKEYLNKLKIK